MNHKDLQNTFERFTKGGDNLNILLGNQRTSYNKTDLGYKLAINVNKLDQIFHDHENCKCKTLKSNY